jgi:hypothetical protein
VVIDLGLSTTPVEIAVPLEKQTGNYSYCLTSEAMECLKIIK